MGRASYRQFRLFSVIGHLVRTRPMRATQRALWRSYDKRAANAPQGTVVLKGGPSTPLAGFQSALGNSRYPVCFTPRLGHLYGFTSLLEAVLIGVLPEGPTTEKVNYQTLRNS